MHVELILQHGWGFDSRIWNCWHQRLDSMVSGISTRSTAELTVHYGERGYYGSKPNTPKFQHRDSAKVIVAHSLGLHLLDEVLLSQADIVVLLSSFLTFHPEDQLSQKRSKRVVSHMRDKLSAAPYAVLDEFLKLCYSHESGTSAIPLPLLTVPKGDRVSVDSLKYDLDLLDRSDRLSEIGRIKKTAFVYLIHGTSDRVVSPDKSIEISTIIPRAQLLLLEQASHALPTMNADTCVDTVRTALIKTMETRYANLSS